MKRHISKKYDKTTDAMVVSAHISVQKSKKEFDDVL
jgi:hypothetical protein